MIKDILKAVSPVARYVDRKHKRKYLERLLKLDRDYDNEDNKPEWDGIDQDFKHGRYRSDTVLNDIELEFMRIIRYLGSEVEKSNIKLPS